jgi:probable addiction module antidote protein
MPKRMRDYREGLLEELQDPLAAANYLDAAAAESEELFLIALRDIAEARGMSKVASDAGVAREAIYRMLSEAGNPTYANFMRILAAVGLRVRVEPIKLTGHSSSGELSKRAKKPNSRA